MIGGFPVINSNTGTSQTVNSLTQNNGIWICDADTPQYGFINPNYMLISDKVWRFARPYYLLHPTKNFALSQQQLPLVGEKDWVSIYLPPFYSLEKET